MIEKCGMPRWHLSWFLPESCVFPSFLSAVHIWISLARGEPCWKIAVAHWVYLGQSKKPSTVFLQFETTLTLGRETFSRSSVYKKPFSLSCRVKDKHGRLRDFDTSVVGRSGGISLAAVIYWYASDTMYILAVSGFGTTNSMNNSSLLLYFSGHGKASLSQRPWGSAARPVVSSGLFVFSKASRLKFHQVWDYMCLRRQWCFSFSSCWNRRKDDIGSSPYHLTQ